MPTPSKQSAATSVTQGDDGTALTVAQIVHLTEQRYLTHIRRADALTEKGAKIKNRLYQARALECAAFLVDYYQRIGKESDASFWEFRRKTCEARAFNHKNQIAIHIGAGEDEEDNNDA
jgi:hypothetical protein